MRRLFPTLAGVVLVLVASVPAGARSFYGAPELLVAGGYSWPVEGLFKDGWEPGANVSGGFRSQVGANIMGGIDIGYTWHGLNESFFPGNVSGGDAGIFSLTSETDIFLGGAAAAEKSMRLFLNGGLGFYYVSVDGGNFAGYNPDFLDVGALGLHGGGGLLIGRGKVRLRVDAAYHHLFMSGDDIGVVPVRGGLQFKLGSGQ